VSSSATSRRPVGWDFTTPRCVRQRSGPW
jgi:hypothetical protein